MLDKSSVDLDAFTRMLADSKLRHLLGIEMDDAAAVSIASSPGEASAFYALWARQSAVSGSTVSEVPAEAAPTPRLNGEAKPVSFALFYVGLVLSALVLLTVVWAQPQIAHPDWEPYSRARAGATGYGLATALGVGAVSAFIVHVVRATRAASVAPRRAVALWLGWALLILSVFYTLGCLGFAAQFNNLAATY